MIEISNFCKAYDCHVAVNDLSVQVEPGQILGLVGPNGAGKTTTLRAITGIIPSSGGEIRVAGFNLANDPLQVKQRTAYVPDDPQLFHDLTVEQHLAFTASVYNVSDAETKSNQLLKEFNLEFKRNAPAADLSRGMRQKLAICCAYMYDPGALLLDEPMTGLDPPGIRMLKQSIVRRAQQGAAVIISSHLLAMVEDICTHVLVLSSGRKRFLGSIEELRYEFGNDTASLEDIFFRALEPDEQLEPEATVEDCSPVSVS
ncbi:MAG: ABC transporter ATP-binding protein [Planctomycetota bacterium]